MQKTSREANDIKLIYPNTPMLPKKWHKRGAQSSLDHWTGELKKAKMLLCEKLNQNELLAMLHPSVEKYKITETGSVTLKVNLHSTPNLIILDEVKAVVDGSIKVLLKVDGEVVGSAVCVLPYGGMSGQTTVNGICCNPTKKAKKYKFDFAPNYLWAVETKEDVFDSWGYEQRKKAEQAEAKRREERNAPIKRAILNGMMPGRVYTIAELQESIPELAEVNSQLIQSLIRSMIGTYIDCVGSGDKVKYRLQE